MIRNKYDVLIIDPPYPKKKGGIRKVRPNQKRDFDYDTMSMDEIFILLDNKVFPMAKSQHVVFLWTIEQFYCESIKKMLERGYRKHVTFIWDKTNGVAPAFTVRFSHEYLIWFYKPKFLSISKDMRGRYTTVFREKSREHSRKPDIAYNMIKSLYPNSKIIDIFSREKRDGIDQWGNQINYFKNK